MATNEVNKTGNTEKIDEKIIQEEKAKLTEEFIKNQDESCDIYRTLISSYEKDGTVTYPDYYGGSYIDSEGRLIIYVIGDEIKATQTIADVAGNSNFKVKKADYTFAKLTKLMHKINIYKLKGVNDITAKNIVAYRIVDSENRIDVELNEFTEEKETEFQKYVTDSPAVNFRKSDGYCEPAISLDPGSGIQANAGTGSIGYRAMRFNGIHLEDGIVTAAHVVTNTLYKYGNPIGICRISRREDSLDAAFCEITDPNYVPSCYTPDGDLSGVAFTPPSGAWVYLMGSKTIFKIGKISSTNSSTTFADDITLTHLISTDKISNSGDSGGLLYYNFAKIDLRLTVGIHLGSNPFHSYMCKAEEIDRQFNLTEY